MNQVALIFRFRTLFGSYPMSVIFILSYWKLPLGAAFLVGQVDRFAFSLCENRCVAAIKLAASDSPPDCRIWISQQTAQRRKTGGFTVRCHSRQATDPYILNLLKHGFARAIISSEY